MKLIRVLRREDASFREAVDLIKCDAAISAEVLRLANSSMSDLRFRPTSILQTLSLLGTKRVASLIATLCVGKLLNQVSKLPLMRRCWRNNLATALIAERWGEKYKVAPDDAYMFGLLNGLGRLALLASDPMAYSQVVEQAETEDRPLEALEARMFGFDSREAGAWLVSEWRLPAELLILFSPRNERAPSSGLAALIEDAGQEATRIGFGLIERTRCDTFDPESFEVAVSVNRVEQGLGV